MLAKSILHTWQIRHNVERGAYAGRESFRIIALSGGSGVGKSTMLDFVLVRLEGLRCQSASNELDRLVLAGERKMAVTAQ